MVFRKNTQLAFITTALLIIQVIRAAPCRETCQQARPKSCSVADLPACPEARPQKIQFCGPQCQEPCLEQYQYPSSYESSVRCEPICAQPRPSQCEPSCIQPQQSCWSSSQCGQMQQCQANPTNCQPTGQTCDPQNNCGCDESNVPQRCETIELPCQPMCQVWEQQEACGCQQNYQEPSPCARQQTCQECQRPSPCACSLPDQQQFEHTSQSCPQKLCTCSETNAPSRRVYESSSNCQPNPCNAPISPVCQDTCVQSEQPSQCPSFQMTCNPCQERPIGTWSESVAPSCQSTCQQPRAPICQPTSQECQQQSPWGYPEMFNFPCNEVPIQSCHACEEQVSSADCGSCQSSCQNSCQEIAQNPELWYARGLPLFSRGCF